MNLLIVESPTKAKHIQHFLGSDWQVKASLGHVRDLEKSGDKSHVRPPDFKMNYAVNDAKHKDIVAGLKSAARNASAVYLATDPDREGEAISWHLCQVLGIKSAEARRVTYQEVTESAVKKAIANPRALNMKLVAAQEVRRGLDRMVGWEVSGPLSNLIHTKASAGRVQTPALRLIVERERAIQAFKPRSYFQVIAHLPGSTPGTTWRALWQDGTKEGKYFQDKALAAALAAAIPSLPLTVTQADSKPTRKAPAPPFTTSTLQMDGSRALKCGAEDVMKAAQSLFEDGHITYHRTDSPNLSEEGETLLRNALQSAGLPIIGQPRRWKAKGDAQEAHEAIRPTFDKVPPSAEVAGEDAIQQALYALIRKRAMASQMPDAVYQQTSCTLNGGTFQNRPAIFRAVGSILTDPGWRTLYMETEEGEEEGGAEKEAANPVPVLQVGVRAQAERGEVLNKSTKAPPRFTEATLIKALEDHGVGRPSTYASIIKVLYSREYMQRKGKASALYPTATGESVIDALVGRFAFADLDWTREMEDGLDQITNGVGNARGLLQQAWDAIQQGLAGMPAGAVAETEQCPVDDCGGQVKRLESTKKPGSFFWACSNRDKHGLLQDDEGHPGLPFADRPQAESQGTGPQCPKCKQATGQFTTSTSKIYFRCQKCSGAWWPDKENAQALGTKWKKQ
ncbi:DNA topoisomerase 1 [Acidithiobacillus ferridurans]|uniref:DNA topoisomerase 1 n=5 Tax=root TaxID=1 RepID=A0A2Z6IEU6_ACIFI|nr:type I DNA topoisomerase [Acidithiobacillus ferridurans]BBF63819.1 DNA topoisomerase 1 [Acidithiobacillus ferridurans]